MRSFNDLKIFEGCEDARSRMETTRDTLLSMILFYLSVGKNDR